MALIVLDPCSLAFSPNPQGGVVQVKDVEGFPEGLMFAIPLGNEQCESIWEMLGEKLGKGKPKVAVASNMEQARREASVHDQLRSDIAD